MYKIEIGELWEKSMAYPMSLCTKLLNDVRKELIKTTLESKQEITKLNDELIKCKEKLATHEKDIESKMTCITKLNLEKAKQEEVVCHYKKDNLIKTEQLKEKNKSLEKIKVNLDKVNMEHDNAKETFINKSKNFENIIKNLNKKLSDTNATLRENKKKIKSLENNKKKNLKTQATETDFSKESIYTQTEPLNVLKNKSIQTEDEPQNITDEALNVSKCNR